MKTILITCFTGLVSRNILSTDALSVLRNAPDVRVVIAAPKKIADDLAREYAGGHVSVVVAPLVAPVGLDRLFWVLATHLLWGETRDVQRWAKLARDGNYLDWLLSNVLGFLGRVGFVRTLFRKLIFRFESQAEYSFLLEQEKPDLLFATDIFTHEDGKLMRLAAKHGIRVIGMVRSWDNITSKTLLSFIPDRVLISTTAMAKELVHYCDVPSERITLCGVPHYDRYTAFGRTPRAEFFRAFGLDPQKKTILFTPPSDNYLKSDPVAPVVLRALERVGAQIFVRLSLVGKTELNGYVPRPGVVIDAPRNERNFVEAHLSPTADHHLADSIFHSDLVITWASTMIIDAVAFGKPVILIGFDATERPYGFSIQQYYDYAHQRKILRTGGVRLAKNPDELVTYAHRYLDDPETDADGRAQIIRDYIGVMDGRAGERLGMILLSALGESIES